MARTRSAFRALPGMKGATRPTVFAPAPSSQAPSLQPVEYTDLLAKVGDASTVKRLLSLKQRFPVGTYPELLTYDWLQRQRLLFEYQVETYGGRGAPGALIPDFVIYEGRGADVWLVQGEYWHTLVGRRQHDEAARLRLLGKLINGVKVNGVIELWEDDIYRHRPNVFWQALAGMEMRR